MCVSMLYYKYLELPQQINRPLGKSNWFLNEATNVHNYVTKSGYNTNFFATSIRKLESKTGFFYKS